MIDLTVGRWENGEERMMKAWKICVEDGPHQFFYVETRARTLDAAIRKVQREVEKTQPWLSISISPWACSEIKKDEE